MDSLLKQSIKELQVDKYLPFSLNLEHKFNETKGIDSIPNKKTNVQDSNNIFQVCIELFLVAGFEHLKQNVVQMIEFAS